MRYSAHYIKGGDQVGRKWGKETKIAFGPIRLRELFPALKEMDDVSTAFLVNQMFFDFMKLVDECFSESISDMSPTFGDGSFVIVHKGKAIRVRYMLKDYEDREDLKTVTQFSFEGNLKGKRRNTIFGLFEKFLKEKSLASLVSGTISEMKKYETFMEVWDSLKQLQEFKKLSKKSSNKMA